MQTNLLVFLSKTGPILPGLRAALTLSLAWPLVHLASFLPLLGGKFPGNCSPAPSWKNTHFSIQF